MTITYRICCRVLAAVVLFFVLMLVAALAAAAIVVVTDPFIRDAVGWVAVVILLGGIWISVGIWNSEDGVPS